MDLIDCIRNNAKPDELVNDVIEDICSNYCKYPDTWDEEAEGVQLTESDICRNCPLNKLEGKK